MKNYPMEINGWNFSGDIDNMSYWKDFGHKVESVALCWLDMTEGDCGWNTEGDAYCCIGSDGNSIDEAIANLYYADMSFGDVMRRDEAEQYLIKYMEMH